MRGLNVVYVSLGDDTLNLDWLAVLRLARQSAEDQLFPDREVPCPFDRFTQDLNALVQRAALPPDPPNNVVADEGRAFDGTADEIARIHASFVRALRETSRETPLVVALDGLNWVIPADFTDRLCPYLLRPVLAGDAGNTRIVLVRRGNEVPLPPDISAGLAIKVDYLRSDPLEIAALVCQYLRIVGLDPRMAPDVMGKVFPPRARTTPNEYLGLVGYFSRESA